LGSPAKKKNWRVLLSQGGHKAVSGLREEINVVDDQKTAPKDAQFDNAWFSRSPAPAEPAAVAKKISPVQKSIEEIKQYAYDAFDKLDTNKNGFIEMDELAASLQDPNVPMREKSFISFLINNHDDIEKSVAEGSDQKTGISRLDIEYYFRLVISQLT
jgi:hypothetical protein